MKTEGPNYAAVGLNQRVKLSCRVTRYKSKHLLPPAFCRLELIKINLLFFENNFQEYHQSIKQFGYVLGPIFCRA